MDSGALLEAAKRHDKRALGQLLTCFERNDEKGEADRATLLPGLENGPSGRVLGITGAPGVGKSSLINELALQMVAADPALSIAVVAVDPTSPHSGGSLLGDRTRTRFPVGEPRLYFRSQPTSLELGGVTLRTFQAVRLLRRLFGLVIVETVGIGQSELAIGDLADKTLLLLAPMGGDQIQFLKSGIMEMPDGFVVNKCDEASLANETYNMLRSGLKTAAVSGSHNQERAVFRCSASTGLGIEELSEWVAGLPPGQDFAAVESLWLRRWVREEYGRRGLVALDAFSLPDGILETQQNWLRQRLGGSQS